MPTLAKDLAVELRDHAPDGGPAAGHGPEEAVRDPLERDRDGRLDIRHGAVEQQVPLAAQAVAKAQLQELHAGALDPRVSCLDRGGHRRVIA